MASVDSPKASRWSQRGLELVPDSVLSLTESVPQ